MNSFLEDSIKGAVNCVHEYIYFLTSFFFSLKTEKFVSNAKGKIFVTLYYKKKTTKKFFVVKIYCLILFFSWQTRKPFSSPSLH